MALRLSYPLDKITVTQEWGENPSWYAKWGYPGHNGIDFRTAVGTLVVACDDGEIEATPEDPEGFGTYIRIRHSWGLSYYAHLSAKENPGLISRGCQVGLSGNTGNSTGPHLHLGIKVLQAPCPGYGAWSDPTLFLEEERDWTKVKIQVNAARCAINKAYGML